MSLDLWTIWAAGLLTFLTPCVLPLVPIYLAALLGGDMQKASGSGKMVLVGRAALFSLGFIAAFTALGMAASSVGAALAAHKTTVQLVGAAIIALFALQFLGIIRIPALQRTVRMDDRRFSSRFAWLNAVVMGFVFAVGWSPCVGPVLGSVLTYTAQVTADPATGALYLGVYGLGFALPLIALAAGAQWAARFIARISPWLPRIEKTTGALLLLVSGWLFVSATQSLDAGRPGTAASGSGAQLAVAGVPTMVEIYEDDCGACAQMKPVVARLQQECHRGATAVRTYNINDPQYAHLVTQWHIVGVPTFLFFDAQGNEVSRLVGIHSEAALRTAFAQAGGTQCAVARADVDTPEPFFPAAADSQCAL